MASLSKILLQDSTLKAALNVSSSKLPSKLLQSSAALFSAHASGASSAIVLPDLPYDYSALEPVISGETMKIHHTKHHATYVNNLNAALEKLGDAVQGSDVAQVIALQAALRFNGGGHLNHSLFWENLKAPTTSSDGNSNVPSAGGALDAAITESFGSVEGLKKEMSDKTIAIQGSGWGWLGFNTSNNRLQIATCANQDPLQPTTGLVPLIGIDVWEHAYYVDYRNVRPDYVHKIWDLINWEVAEARLAKVKAAK